MIATRRRGPAGRDQGRLAIAVALAFLLLPCATWARALNDEEKLALKAAVESFETALREGNYALALPDEGKWFLLRVNDDAQVEILLGGHPEFASTEFPRGSIETLNP